MGAEQGAERGGRATGGSCTQLLVWPLGTESRPGVVRCALTLSELTSLPGAPEKMPDFLGE